MNLDSWLMEHGFDFTSAQLNLDGEFHELKTDKFKGWYAGSTTNGNTCVTFGDWRTDERKTYKDNALPTTPEEIAKAKEQEHKIQIKKKAKQLDTKLYANQFWKKLTPLGVSPYLNKKSITSAHGSVTTPGAYGIDTIIPMYFKQEIWNFQRIQEDGFKQFAPGGLSEGCYYILDNEAIDGDGNIIICEGFATACSIKEAVGSSFAVVCAFKASNLVAVSKYLRSMCQGSRIIVAADNDHTKNPNVGIEQGRLAAGASQGELIYPQFGPQDKSLSDFNDVHQKYGLEKVKEYFMSNIVQEKHVGGKLENTSVHIQPTAITKYANGVTPMDRELNLQGNPKPLTDFKVANALLEYYGDRILSFNNSIFIYKDNHWQEMGVTEENMLQVQINVLLGGLDSHAKIESVFKLFKKHVKASPVDFYKPNPYLINLANGTVHVVRRSDKWLFEFKPHNINDYCTNIIPIEFDDTREIRNKPFEEMLDRVLGKDEDGLEKIRAVRQMYGACIAPIFPHLFLIHGPGGSGKTTIIIPAMRLVETKNLCSVEPHEFEGFKMESMAGKLVNVVTDITLDEPIRDAHIKKIEDTLNVRIDRKFKDAIMAPLPAVHVFGGNGIPATLEKGSGAHKRRWTFIKVNKFNAENEGNYSKTFANDLFNDCPQGVLNFALEGLQEVLDNNGHYLNPKSGISELLDWQLGGDSVGLFLKDIEDGQVLGMRLDRSSKIKPSVLWDVFKKWYLDAYNQNSRLGKHKFYKMIENRDHKKVKVEGQYFFYGFNSVDQSIESRI